MQITNSRFICSSCGDMADIASVLQLHANYGSAHDGTRLDLKLCGRCMDAVFNFIQQERKKKERKYNDATKSNRNRYSLWSG